MYVIVERETHSVVCYSDGTRQVFCNKDSATDYALALSANNPGVYSVHNWLSPDSYSYHRLCVDFRNRLKVRGVRMPITRAAR